jgi:Flp pilus assembly protein TadG
MKQANRRMRRRRNSGQTVVEFALVLPVLLALVMGIMEFGWLGKNSLQLANAAREGARKASLGHTTASVRSGITARSSPLAVTTTIDYTIDNTNYVTLTDSGGVNVAPKGSLIRVKVTSRHQPLTGILPFLWRRDLVASAQFGRE